MVDPTEEHEDISDSLESRKVQFVVTEENVDQRIDLFLSLKCDGYSRMFLRTVLLAEKVLVDGRPVKPAFRIQVGQVIDVDLPPPPSDGPIPENIALNVLFEDEHLVIINKPAVWWCIQPKGIGKEL